jgi:hypothetical protein
MVFANIVPRQFSPIPWGWTNKTVPSDVVGLPSKLTFVEKPLGEIRMPSLVEHFDWTSFVIEDFKKGKLFGTQNFKSIFTTAARFLGYERLLAEMPSLHRITDGFLEWNDRLLETIGDKLSYFMIGDDIAGNDGLFMDVRDFESWILPNYLRLLEKAKSFCFEWIFHSDGDIYEILPLLRDAGFEGVSFQPIGMMASFRDCKEFEGLNLYLVEDQARENEETLRLQRGKE